MVEIRSPKRIKSSSNDTFYMIVFLTLSKQTFALSVIYQQKCVADGWYPSSCKAKTVYLARSHAIHRVDVVIYAKMFHNLGYQP